MSRTRTWAISFASIKIFFSTSVAVPQTALSSAALELFHDEEEEGEAELIIEEEEDDDSPSKFKPTKKPKRKKKQKQRQPQTPSSEDGERFTVNLLHFRENNKNNTTAHQQSPSRSQKIGNEGLQPQSRREQLEDELVITLNKALEKADIMYQEELKVVMKANMPSIPGLDGLLD